FPTFAGTTQPVVLTVTYAANYTGTVTIAIPTVSAPLSSIAVSSGSSNVLHATGTASFDVGAASVGTTNLVFHADDGLGGAANLGIPVNVTGYTLTAALTAGFTPTPAAGGLGTRITVSVIGSGGFNGSVLVAPPTLTGFTFQLVNGSNPVVGSGSVDFKMV